MSSIGLVYNSVKTLPMPLSAVISSISLSLHGEELMKYSLPPF